MTNPVQGRASFLLLFDCDGTLVDSQHTIADTMIVTFREHGLPPPTLEATRGVIGLSLPIAIATLLGRTPDDVAAAMADSYRRHFHALRSRPDFTEPLFPGAASCLERLARRSDLALGVVTGKSRRGVAALCAGHGFDGTFRTVRTADDCPSKPDPAMVLECCAETGIPSARTVVIGDTRFDMEMARAAGAASIGVTWGYHHEAELIAAGAAMVIPSFDDLDAAIEAVAGRETAA